MKKDFKYSAGVCAKCGSDNILYNDPIITDVLTYSYTCEDCHAKGHEIYNIDFCINKLIN